MIDQGPPHAVLSDRVHDLMARRRLVAAIFVTFEFDPDFFECQVLPVIIDVPLSHADSIRRVQLEDAMRRYAGRVAVYYDSNGLVRGTSGSAKLDFQRIQVRHRNGGVFHPKNLLLLVEPCEPDENGHHAQLLIVGAMSANLTRSGWWSNVEAAHFEEISVGSRTSLRDDLLTFLRALKERTPSEDSHDALELIERFLKNTEPTQNRSSNGELHPQFYGGSGGFLDFLDKAAGPWLQGACMEIISPYFDATETSMPLEALIERFSPKEVRLFLAKTRVGKAALSEALYDSLNGRDSIGWGRLPARLLKMGNADDVGSRFVHAKVYRFFTRKPKREICFIGSVNLTRPAHQVRGGNWESGLLVEVNPPNTEFWLELEHVRPPSFEPGESEDAANSGGSPLTLRFDWIEKVASVFWDDNRESPSLQLGDRGTMIGKIGRVRSRVWTTLPDEFGAAVEKMLSETSFIGVDDGSMATGLILVQEVGMAHKPSLLLTLSAIDILRYWSLLTAEQRGAFLEAQALAGSNFVVGEGSDLVTVSSVLKGEETFFDRMAGFFHAFSSLEADVRKQIVDGREGEACYRLFGKKYDSLGTLIDRVARSSDVSDDVDCYVLLQCARQLCRTLAKERPEFWTRHRKETEALEQSIDCILVVRARLVAKSSDTMPQFLDWFDEKFMKRAAAVTP